jgi:hypothetical protein
MSDAGLALASRGQSRRDARAPPRRPRLHVTQVSEELAPTEVWSFSVNGKEYRGAGVSAPMVVNEGDTVDFTLPASPHSRAALFDDAAHRRAARRGSDPGTGSISS